jgi:DNA-directed RNA polymerase sigma subunit (sigma70/sigma32)
MENADVEVDITLNRMVAHAQSIEMPMPYETIGDICGLSKQAVHQIERRALRKLANNNWELRRELFDTKMRTPIQEGNNE